MFARELPGTAAECVAELEELERLKSALCARQARLAARLDETDVRVTTSEKAMATEVGLARHESPHRGARLLKLARALVEDHPEVLALLESGELNERRAELIVHETADLALPDRRAADAALAEHLATVPCLGDRDLVDVTRRIVFRLDEAAATKRRERAHRDRHVEARARRDGTGQVTGVVADWQMAAIMASLGARADLLRHEGDERTRAQIVADLFVERLAGLPGASGVPVMLDLVMDVETLLGEPDEPAQVPGLGPVPASVARGLVLASPEARTALRRLFADTDHLVAMESRARIFPRGPAPSSSRCATAAAALRGATPRSATPITSRRPREAVRPPSTTARGSARRATTPRRTPASTHTVTSVADLEPHATTITTPAGAVHRLAGARRHPGRTRRTTSSNADPASGPASPEAVTPAGSGDLG